MTYDEAINSLLETCQNLKDGIEFYEKRANELTVKNKKLKLAIIGCATIIGVQTLILVKKKK